MWQICILLFWLDNDVNQVTELSKLVWVSCASGNVYPSASICRHLQTNVASESVPFIYRNFHFDRSLGAVLTVAKKV